MRFTRPFSDMFDIRDSCISFPSPSSCSDQGEGRMCMFVTRGHSLLPASSGPNLSVQGGTVVNHDQSFVADVLIKDQLIEAVGPDLQVRTPPSWLAPVGTPPRHAHQIVGFRAKDMVHMLAWPSAPHARPRVCMPFQPLQNTVEQQHVAVARQPSTPLCGLVPHPR